jgi:hypothetical protein
MTLLFLLAFANLFLFACNMAFGVFHLTDNNPESAMLSFLIGAFNLFVAIILFI